MNNDTDRAAYTLDPQHTVQDAARRLRVSNRAILKWIHRGTFPGAYKLNPNLPNSPYRIPGRDIAALEASRHNTTEQ